MPSWHFCRVFSPPHWKQVIGSSPHSRGRRLPKLVNAIREHCGSHLSLPVLSFHSTAMCYSWVGHELSGLLLTLSSPLNVLMFPAGILCALSLWVLFNVIVTFFFFWSSLCSTSPNFSLLCSLETKGPHGIRGVHLKRTRFHINQLVNIHHWVFQKFFRNTLNADQNFINIDI